MTTFHHALAPGTRIEEFEIGVVLGAGGFGITYKGVDHQFRREVAIKEYLPTDLAMRGKDAQTVQPRVESERDNYRYGLERFLEEARVLARFQEPGIVRVLRFLQANGTAYLVMEYEQGETLTQFLNRCKEPLAEEELKLIFLPVLEGLQAVHAADFLHRDIKPSNIYLRKKGPPMLIDFGAARQALGQHSQSLTSVLSPGYAPFEQYSTRSRQGPWSDIYAAGATLYRCIAGVAPVDAAERMNALLNDESDPLRPAAEWVQTEYSPGLLQTVDWMLAPRAAERPQSVQQVLERLYGEPGRSTQSSSATRTRAATTAATRTVAHSQSRGQKPARRGRLWMAGALGLMISGLAIVWAWRDGSIETPSHKTQAVREYTLLGHTDAVTSVAFSPDGRRLASASADKTIQLWDVNSGRLQQTLSGHTHWAAAVVFSPDGQRLASAGHDNTLRLWDASSGTLQQTLSGHTNFVAAVVFSPDGRRLASASWDKTLRLWDAETGRLRQTLSGHASTVAAVVFSPDGRRLASASADKTLRIWDAETGDLQQTLLGHSNTVMSVVFSPDGQRLASASWDGSIRLWDAASGTLQQTLSGHTNWVQTVVFSADGRWLASGSTDKTIRLWDAESGTPQQTLSGHTEWVAAVVFSPDGRRLASASADKTARIWDVSTAEKGSN